MVPPLGCASVLNGKVVVVVGTPTFLIVRVAARALVKVPVMICPACRLILALLLARLPPLTGVLLLLSSLQVTSVSDRTVGRSSSTTVWSTNFVEVLMDVVAPSPAKSNVRGSASLGCVVVVNGKVVAVVGTPTFLMVRV